MATLRLGTRGSLLARTQSQLVASAIEKHHPDVTVELVILKTTGDVVQDRPLADLGGKGLFTKELELALLRNEIDLAVHSFKDVPVTMPLVDTRELVITAVPEREDARDLLVTRRQGEGRPPLTLNDLPPGARVGTGSPRRRCQLLAQRPDLVIEPIRGNIDTRLRKLNEGQYDAIVLAMAGMKRVGLYDSSVMTALDPALFTPSAGQGALALQTRHSDAETRQLLQALHDPIVADCVTLEREVIRLLDGDCHSPIAAYAWQSGDSVSLMAATGEQGGNLPLRRALATAPVAQMNTLPAAVVLQLGERTANHP